MIMKTIFYGLLLAVSIGELSAAEVKSPNVSADGQGTGRKNLAYLVIQPGAKEGSPEIALKGAAADRKLQARLKANGFAEAAAVFSTGLTLDYLKQFNVVVYFAASDNNPGFAGLAKEKKALLLRYVEEGGGLLVLRMPDWAFGSELEALNVWLKPCGIQVLLEQVVDEDYAYRLPGGNRLFWTDNLADHPVAKGVKGLFYPETEGTYNAYTDFTSPLKTDEAWTVIVRGRKTAKALVFKNRHGASGGSAPVAGPGTYETAPPLLAVRNYGKGRIAVWPTISTCMWQDGYHFYWGKGLTMDGIAQGMKGDAARLLENLFAYLAEPSKGMFGGYIPSQKNAEAKEAGFVQIDWDHQSLTGATMTNCYRGLIGAQTCLSSGKGAPEEFIEASKKAGYQFIAFTEDLERFSAEKLDQLKTICAKYSDDSFMAYPGFAYVDESGNSWATFSDFLKWPSKDWWSTNHPGRIVVNSILVGGLNWPPVILLKAHSNPEKPWFQGNYKVFSVYTYENGKCVDDSLDLYRRLQKESFQLAPVAVHLVAAPGEIEPASKQGYQTYIRWYDNHIVSALSGHYCLYKGQYVWYRSSFVSEGPLLEDAVIVNFGTSDLAIPGGDRFRMHVRAASAAGLKEVAIMDSDSPRPWRRFLPGGVKAFEQTIDGFHDKAYNFICLLTDVNGKKAVGWECWTDAQENSYLRCSDNYNSMPGGKWSASPKEMQNPRGFECYAAFRGRINYFGIPGVNGVEDCARPAVEFYPFHASRFATIIDCILDQHYPLSAIANFDRTDIPECAVPNESLTGKARHTLFVPWNDGPLVELVEGDLVAKKDLAAKQAIVFNQSRRMASFFCASTENGTPAATLLSRKTPAAQGSLPLNGLVALFPQPFNGSLGAIALQNDLTYTAWGGEGEYSSLRLMWNAPGGTVKSGDKITYRYLGVISQLDPPTDNRFVADIRNTLGIGGKPAYQMEAVSGSVQDTSFVLKLKSKDFGFSGKITEAKLPLMLPVSVEGLNPRWDAGIWYKGQATRIIPEWTINEIGQRYIERKPRTEADALIHIPVLEDGTGLLQVDTEVGAKDLFIGNFLVSDNPDVHLTLVDTRSGKAAFVIHNPTDAAITCKVHPTSGFSLLGNFDKLVTVPAGSSVQVAIP